MNLLKYETLKCLFASAVCLTMAACNDDVLPDTGQGGTETNGQQECIINAYIDNGTQTRTSMGELSEGKYPVLWSEGDQITVFNDNSRNPASLTATLIDGEGTNKAVFKGKYWYLAQNALTSIYPLEGAAYSVKSSTKTTLPDGSSYFKRENTVTAVLPSTQDYKVGTFANNVLPMVGYCLEKGATYNAYDFRYENMGGVLQLPVKGNGKISKIILWGNNDEVLAGKFTVRFDYWIWSTKPTDVTEDVSIKYLEESIPEANQEACQGRWITASADESTGQITIDCGEDGLQLDPSTATMINIAMLPTTFTKGFSVRFVDKDNGGSFVKTTSQSITVKRSYVKKMKDFDYETPEPLEPANCYVVDSPGYYLIPAFCMGNQPKSARLAVDADGNSTVTGNPVAAAYLWTDAPGAITDIEYIPGKDGYISFKANAQDGEAPKGNTVIALYDSVTKEILWSWHIWMTEINEVKTNGKCDGRTTTDGFTSTAANGWMVIMDRNLGATSANKDDGWKTYGLYYQMGRKDPFIGCNRAGQVDGLVNAEYQDANHYDSQIKTYGLYEVNPFEDYTTYTEWNTELAPNGWNFVQSFITAVQGYQHPMDYASGYDDKSDTRWTTDKINTTAPFISKGGHEDFWNRTKTINDPCPAGWTMLGEGSGFWGSPDNTLSTLYASDGVYGIEAVYTNKSTGETSTVWWPAAGFRSVDALRGNVGLGGYYWAYDHIAATHGGHGASFLMTIDSKTGKYTLKSISDFGKVGVMTNHASSVRCVKAQQPSSK